ncbi:hypothetical protein REPUB_Repub08aG0129800 [Reevesia pubescens]
MKICSWNVNGLGRKEKRRVVHRLVTKNKLDFVFIQESKVSSVDRKLIHCLWSCGNLNFVSSYSIGSTGGLISVWSNDFFESKTIFQRYLVVIGRIVSLNLRCAFVNLYAPNDDEERLASW